MKPDDLPLGQRLAAALALQRAACRADPVPGLARRLDDLKRLQALVRDHRDALCDAIAADYGGHRSRHETLLCEIAPVVDGIGHAMRQLGSWMAPRRRAVDRLTFPGARNEVLPQPLGVVGVIVPWNFPLNTSLVPLTGILAAGNRAMLKMSENSRHTAALLIDRLPRYFAPEQLQIFDETGGVGEAFASLPFDHLLFTGSTETGRRVMAAAAANLCPVTLELGGKSPAIVLDDFPLRTAAERILFAKCLNAGQVCTSVDHAWIPQDRIPAFVEQARAIVAARYGSLASPDLGAIIDDRAFGRLCAALDEARERGARLVPLLDGPSSDPRTRKIAPHLVLDAPGDCALMSREIFGPILPVCGYRDLDVVLETINDGPRPLALYPFSRDRAAVERIIRRVMSGGVSVNDALFHVAQHDLPFGGVGASGMGHYHGIFGFDNFSKLRPVFHQARVSPLKALGPPYGRVADALLRFLIP